MPNEIMRRREHAGLEPLPWVDYEPCDETTYYRPTRLAPLLRSSELFIVREFLTACRRRHTPACAVITQCDNNNIQKKIKKCAAHGKHSDTHAIVQRLKIHPRKFINKIIDNLLVTDRQKNTVFARCRRVCTLAFIWKVRGVLRGTA